MNNDFYDTEQAEILADAYAENRANGNANLRGEIHTDTRENICAETHSTPRTITQPTARTADTDINVMLIIMVAIYFNLL